MFDQCHYISLKIGLFLRTIAQEVALSIKSDQYAQLSTLNRHCTRTEIK
jgi:hypothetical protein